MKRLLSKHQLLSAASAPSAIIQTDSRLFGFPCQLVSGPCLSYTAYLLHPDEPFNTPAGLINPQLWSDVLGSGLKGSCAG